MPTKEPQKEPIAAKKVGRKTIVEGIDLDKVEQWGYLKTSYADMAALLGIGESTVEDWMYSKGNNFREAYKRGLAKGNDKIRELQIKAAENGSHTMLVWLGKVRLGQTEDARDAEQEAPSQLVIHAPKDDDATE